MGYQPFLVGWGDLDSAVRGLDCLLVDDAWTLARSHVESVRHYVKQGGGLIATGDSRVMLGNSEERATVHENSKIILRNGIELSVRKGKYNSVPSNGRAFGWWIKAPPALGVAMTTLNYGKGRVVCSSIPVAESLDRDLGSIRGFNEDDRSIGILLKQLICEATGLTHPIAIRKWPAPYRSATLVTFDVESAGEGPVIAFILRVLNDYCIRATFNVCGNIVTKITGTLEEIIANRHEVAGHSYAHVPLGGLNPSTTRRMLDRNIHVIRSNLHIKIRGLRSPECSWTPMTLRIIDSLGFLWNSDHTINRGSSGLQMPYHVPLSRSTIDPSLWDDVGPATYPRHRYPKSRFVELPLFVPDDWYYYCVTGGERSYLDRYRELGKEYRGKLLVALFHPRLITNQFRKELFDKIMRGLARKDVWATTCSDMAEWQIGRENLQVSSALDRDVVRITVKNRTSILLEGLVLELPWKPRNVRPPLARIGRHGLMLDIEPHSQRTFRVPI